MYKISARISGLGDSYVPKMRCILKIAAILLVMFLVQLLDADAFSQRINFVQKQVNLVQMFKVIKKQTHYNVVWFEHNLDTKTTFDANFKDATITEVLDRTLLNQAASYEINGKTIVIKPKVPGKDEKLKKTAINAPEIDGEPLTGGKLEEVEINAGYYTVKDKERTGSISRITAETLAKQPIINPLQGLQGRMTGVQITQQTGLPGGGFSVQIRGKNSLRTAGNDPLYVLDGIPFATTSLHSNTVLNANSAVSPLNSISPDEIESIEVLKDADATAIYGSRGANRVVLITTKKGRSGKTSLSLNAYTGIGKANQMDLLNTQQWLEMRNEAFQNDGIQKTELNAPDLLLWDQNRYTDWQKVLIGGTAHSSQINGSISGGTQQTQFIFSSAYLRETTVFPGDFAYQKGSGHFNLNHSSENNKFKLMLSAGYTTDLNQLMRTDLTVLATALAPNAPALYTADGDLNWENGTWSNPLAQLRNRYQGKTGNLSANSSLSYRLLAPLNFKVDLGYSNLHMDELSVIPISSLAPTTANKTGSAVVANNTLQTWSIEPQLDYQLSTGNGKLNFLIGSTLQQTLQDATTISGSGFTSDLLLENIKSAPAVSISSTLNPKYRYMGLYFRANYTLKEKYILNLTARRDGSSRFGPDKRFGNFGAVGTAWIFSKEPLVQELLPWLSFGKLRASYGTTGSDLIGDYMYLSTYSATTYSLQNAGGLIPLRHANADYSWETNRKLEGSIELGFLNDRIKLNLTAYKNRSSNQLVGYNLPVLTGFNTVQFNFPATVQNTGFEFELNTINVQNKQLNWTTGLNLTIPNNQLISYPNIQGSSYANTYEVGQSIFAPKKLQYTGVNPQTGLYTYLDYNGNGKTNEITDRLSGKVIGQSLYGGLNNTLKYKGFQLDIFFQFVKQIGRNYMSSFNSAPGALFQNQPVIVMSRWQKPDDQSNVQRFTVGGTAASTAYNPLAAQTGDNVYTDASYFRLKNTAVSWSLPDILTKKLKLQNARLYFQGQNLLTFSNYIGLDPETLSSNTLPPLRVYTLGMQFIF